MNKKIFLLSAFICAGFIFFNCQTESENSGGGDSAVSAVVNNSSFSSGSSSSINGFSVTYDGNNNIAGSVPADNTVYSHSTTVTVKLNSGNLSKIPAAGTAEAFKFGGWNTKADGSGTTYTAGTGTFTITANVTLYTKWIKFELGDKGPANGWIFYDKGSYSNNWRYLEAAPSDLITTIDWSNVTDKSAGTGTAIGNGSYNTGKIIGQSGHIESIASKCTSLSIINNGVTYKDWFLPSKDELNLMYQNIKNIGGFATSSYCSSSEFSATIIWSQSLITGTQLSMNAKSLNYKARSCRVF